MAKRAKATTDEGKPVFSAPGGVCRRRQCEEDIGAARHWCKKHEPRTLDKHQRQRLVGRFVFGVPQEDAPYEVLGHFKSRDEALAFRQGVIDEGEYGYETKMGRVVLVADDDTALNGSPEMRQAIEDYLDLLDEGGTTMASLKQARAKAAKPKTAATRNRSRVTKDCLCECGGQTMGGRFLPGHDAKLKGKMQTAFREAHAAGKSTAKVEKAFADFGWDKYIPNPKADAAKVKARNERLAKLKDKKAKPSKVTSIKSAKAKKVAAAKKSKAK